MPLVLTRFLQAATGLKRTAEVEPINGFVPVSMTRSFAAGQKTTRTLLVLAILLLTLYFAVQVVRVGLLKNYSIDEFTYAHAAWLISKGQVPYRDFFCHHFPLAYYIQALPFLFLDDDPNNVRFLRVVMLPFLGLLCMVVVYINGRRARGCGVVTPFLMLSVPAFVLFAVEIRPDPIALTLFLCAVAVLHGSKAPPAIRGYVSGVLLGTSVWVSEKVLVYGVVFAIGLLIDLLYNRKRNEGYLLTSPVAFVLGGATAAAAIVLYMTATHSWKPWFQWSIQWSAQYQERHGGFPWQRHFWRTFPQFRWLVPFAALGIVETLRSPKWSGPDRWTNPDLLLCGAMATTILSLSMQKAAYAYSLLPILAVGCIFAARGLIVTVAYLNRPEGVSKNLIAVVFFSVTGLYIWRLFHYSAFFVIALLLVFGLGRFARWIRLWLEAENPVRVLIYVGLALILALEVWNFLDFSRIPIVLLLLIPAIPGMKAALHSLTKSQPATKNDRRCALVLLFGFIAVQFGFSHWRLEDRLARKSNKYQHEVLTQLHELTTPEDPVYDNSGGFVTRPHVFFFYFTNSFMRRHMGRTLAFDVPKAIGETGCTVVMHDVRLKSCPKQLRDFLESNFHAWSAEIWIWGRRYEAKAEYTLSGNFYAVRDGQYFIEPASAVENGILTVDGAAVTTPIFRLRKGIHKIEYDGPSGAFHILWLPSNGKPFRPKDDRAGRFSSLF